MATKRQIEMNRLNAKKSTGPITAEGKAQSSLNGIKHGLYSNVRILPDESAEEFTEFRRFLMEDMKPDGAMQVLFAEIDVVPRVGSAVAPAGLTHRTLR